jgi:hypothetical protein
MKVLIDESGISTFYFNANAAGEEHPIADNDTEEGRQKNRRVEIAIAPTTPVKLPYDIYGTGTEDETESKITFTKFNLDQYKSCILVTSSLQK